LSSGHSVFIILKEWFPVIHNLLLL
jgi:hypothetical protein